MWSWRMTEAESMTQEQSPARGPDLTQGVVLAEFAGGKLMGHLGDEEVLLVQNEAEIFAIAAQCSHYRGPLSEGLVVGDSIRCPWHHACFDLRSGEAVAYDRLLLATGAEPVRLPVPGADQPHVHTLRSLADCRAIIDTAEGVRRALVIGASFIGLEVAAALRARDIEVHVVAPEKRPMERILGPGMGDFVRALHEEHGVVFHLEDTVVTIEGQRATLKSGDVLEAGLVVVGIGVRPRLALAERAGLAIDRGVLVNAFLETSVPGIYAAGDIARWPDPHSDGNIRVEHWVVGQRQGQTAALNMMAQRVKFDAVPFFWSQHYDVPINYVGHAEQWDEITVDGEIKTKDCLLKYKRKGRVLAVASIFRDLASLEAEVKMEHETIL
jgi:NADPH-dependent 2,4-dienoyl-CoA reductase/sulfur reductase-like enzyme